jgi:hypothetical protein
VIAAALEAYGPERAQFWQAGRRRERGPSATAVNYYTDEQVRLKPNTTG